MKSIIKTPAKINLFLKITGIDPVSGLHFLETLMSPINLFDELEITPSRDFSIEIKGLKEVVLTEKNIVYKVYEAVKNYTGETLPRFSIKIKKNIPAGAGLGGGSSNGAGFLLFLNSYCNLSLNMAQLVEIAFETGSDVPFFLYNSPAVVSGTGNIIEPVEISPIHCNMLLIYPGISIDTKLAYSLYDKKKLTNYRCVDIYPLREKTQGSLKNWTSEIVNDFEETVFEHWPEIYELKLSLERFGAQKVFMSGSGSSLVAIFESNEVKRDAKEHFFQEGRVVKNIKLLTV